MLWNGKKRRSVEKNDEGLEVLYLTESSSLDDWNQVQ